QIVDENSQEDLWDAIRHRYVQWNITIIDGEVNRPPVRGDFLKVVCTSDTHELLENIIDLIPDGDVLIHAGDFTNFGDEGNITLFNELMGQLPHPHKLVIAGNHEMGFDHTEDLSIRRDKYRHEGTPEGWELLTNVTYLQDSSVEIDGVIFYGSPWHPLKGYPFYRPRHLIDHEWSRFPDRIDVLITHVPPLGYMDFYPNASERWGDFSLLNRVNDLRPKFHVFGHNHFNYGAQSNGPTTFMNVAAKNGTTKEVHIAPLVFYIAKQR
ncbi:hypothetical protein PFISCL1PPCAC_18718, partial [Pristionchus fissidentatus]